MARPLRIEFPGAVDPVTRRTNAPAVIDEDDRDRRISCRFLEHGGTLTAIASTIGPHDTPISHIVDVPSAKERSKI